MGLGLFIAKTLLERSGAELSFANGRDPLIRNRAPTIRPGAIIESVWKLSDVAIDAADGRVPLGLNRQIEI